MRETKALDFTNPQLQELLHQYLIDWGLNAPGYIPPAKWMGRFDEETLLAAVGFTVAPDGSVVFVADLLCRDDRSGIRAMAELMREFVTYCVAEGRVQSVCAQAVYYNTTMRKFIERVGLRPLAVVYGVTREQFSKGIR